MVIAFVLYLMTCLAAFTFFYSVSRGHGHRGTIGLALSTLIWPILLVLALVVYGPIGQEYRSKKAAKSWAKWESSNCGKCGHPNKDHFMEELYEFKCKKCECR